MPRKKYESLYATLPEELIIEFLTRLPAKSLYKCVLVCKFWYKVIKNAKFVSSHLNHQIAKTYTNDGPRYLLYCDLEMENFFVYNDNNTFNMHLELTFPHDFVHEEGFKVVGVCDGIVCFANYYEAEIVIWNPSLGLHLDLFSPHRRLEDEFYFPGFGFDPVANEYKVILGVHTCELYQNKTTIVGVFVYSIKKGATWKHVDANVTLDGDCIIGLDFGNVNGVITWSVKTGNGRDVDSLLMFNLADEKFTKDRLPKVETNDYFFYDHMMMAKRSCGDSIALLGCSRGGDFLYFWVLEDVGRVKSWRKAHSIKTVGLGLVVNMRWNGEINFAVSRGEGVISVDPKTMASQQICDKNLQYVGPYIENLVRL